MADGRVQLQDKLGDDLEVLAELTDDECGELLGMLEQARRDEARALNDAMEEALGHLPRLLRGTARTIVFGGKGPR